MRFASSAATRTPADLNAASIATAESSDPCRMHAVSFAAASATSPVAAPSASACDSTHNALQPNTVPVPQPSAINFATEWLDEAGRVCPKNVDYATQCPKGHSILPFVSSSDPQAEHPSDANFTCRVCHASKGRQNVSDWLACNVPACCGGYAVCAACATALRGAQKQAPAASADFCMMVRFCVQA